MTLTDLRNRRRSARRRGDSEAIRRIMDRTQELRENEPSTGAEWPPEGWRIVNPNWPSGKGPHIEPEDE
jgi:hypothetical protein